MHGWEQFLFISRMKKLFLTMVAFAVMATVATAQAPADTHGATHASFFRLLGIGISGIGLLVLACAVFGMLVFGFMNGPISWHNNSEYMDKARAEAAANKD